MTTTAINIKSLCEDFVSSSNPDSIFRSLNKMSNILRTFEKFQRDTFIALSDKGFNKLLACLKDKSLDIRRLAFRLLVDLLYNNDVLQNIFCEKFNFNPVGNVICFNWMPKPIKENLKFDARVLKNIKQSTNIQPRRQYWMWPDNVIYTDDNLPDPQKYLFGVYYGNKNNINPVYFGEDNIQNENLDINSLILKLEYDQGVLEDQKLTFVAAGSGSESSCKINDFNEIKDKRNYSGNISQLDNSKKDSKNSLSSGINSSNINKNSINSLNQNLNLSGKNIIYKSKQNSKAYLNNNESLSSSLIISNQNVVNTANKNTNLNEKNNSQKPLVETPKNNLKDEYKRIAKDKNYSRSIDGNIPKTKYAQYQMTNLAGSDSNNNATKYKFNPNIVTKNKK